MKKRIKINISGRVQGVGFRPSVYRHAVDFNISGFVKNASTGVIIEAEADEKNISAFLNEIQNATPRYARIEQIKVQEIEVTDKTDFQIAPSIGSADIITGMPPDLATCDDCVRELFNSHDRRYCYPFINCTNCGPRFTIIKKLPYDREMTSMAEFKMCKKCAKEYADPMDRRFDAQPDACSVCGPKLDIIDADKNTIPGDPILKTADFVKRNAIVAIKGVGGYHLACDACSDTAVRCLRKRKNRPYKAFAVMFRSIEAIKQYCLINEYEIKELLSAARPIVILPRKTSCGLSALISPDTNDIGAMFPYTPIHHLLLNEVSPLVMTSGNLADEPIAKDERELKPVLGRVADYALVHNRAIVRRCDDSVLKIVNGEKLFLRRSRGYVPDSIKLPFNGLPVLGCGAELKNTFCITRGNKAFVSQHIGDLTEYRSYEFFVHAIDDLRELLDISPVVIAHDMHPDYMSKKYADKLYEQKPTEIKLESVQHHHAHIASCMAEHQLCESVIGVALDGTGLGEDGTLWGGEFLVADFKKYQRMFHFKQHQMPGGDQATMNPERMAFSYLRSDMDADSETITRILPGINKKQKLILDKMLKNGIYSPLTSSAGRLFDAVSAMLGLCSHVSYEGQAAIRLQTIADTNIKEVYPFNITGKVLDFSPMIRAIVMDIEEGVDKSCISAKFHNTVALGVSKVCWLIRQKNGIEKVVLSGGVFQNHILLKLVKKKLHKQGFKVYNHFILPPNDACIGLGQAIIALARTEKR